MFFMILKEKCWVLTEKQVIPNLTSIQILITTVLFFFFMWKRTEFSWVLIRTSKLIRSTTNCILINSISHKHLDSKQQWLLNLFSNKKNKHLLLFIYSIEKINENMFSNAEFIHFIFLEIVDDLIRPGKDHNKPGGSCKIMVGITNQMEGRGGRGGRWGMGGCREKNNHWRLYCEKFLT